MTGAGGEETAVFCPGMGKRRPLKSVQNRGTAGRRTESSALAEEDV